MTASVAVMTPAEADKLTGWWVVGRTGRDENGAPAPSWIVCGGPGEESLRAYRDERWDGRWVPDRRLHTLRELKREHKEARKPTTFAVPAVMAHLLTGWPVTRFGAEEL